jgi:hypothetical protein
MRWANRTGHTAPRTALVRRKSVLLRARIAMVLTALLAAVGAGFISSTYAQLDGSTHDGTDPFSTLTVQEVTGLAVVGGNGSASLSWTASTTGAIRSVTYTVSRGTTATGPWTTVVTGLTAVAYSDTPSGAGTWYYLVTTMAGTFSKASTVVSAVVATPDTTAPTISLTTPATLAVASVTTAVTASASDNVGVSSVQMYLDGIALGAALTTAPYTYNWDTTTAINGRHQLTATATDAAGNSTTSTTRTIAVVKMTAVENWSTNATATTPTFSTTTTGQLLLALVEADALPGSTQTVSSLTGAGLTWTRIVRSNTQRGDSEIWWARAPTTLTNVTVSSVLTDNRAQSLQVVAIATTSNPGASATAHAATGAQTISLVATAANSLVVGAGDDWDQGILRTIGPNQTMLNDWISPNQDTLWSQYASLLASAAGATVTLNDTAPTADEWNMAAVEVPLS